MKSITNSEVVMKPLPNKIFLPNRNLLKYEHSGNNLDERFNAGINNFNELFLMNYVNG